MRYQNEIRSLLIEEMVDAGELIRKGEDYFEDMGGHILHESNLDSYISYFLNSMSESERIEIKERVGVFP